MIYQQLPYLIKDTFFIIIIYSQFLTYSKV